MADLNGFNASNVEPAAGFDPIPAGKYPAVITDSEMKPNNAGTGAYLQLDVSDHRRRVQEPLALGTVES